MKDFVKFLLVILFFNLSVNTSSAQEISASDEKEALTSEKIKKKGLFLYSKILRQNYSKNQFLIRNPEFYFH